MAEHDTLKATEIPITSREHEAQMRQHVTGIVEIDVIQPDVAYACGRCGTVLAFAKANSVVSTRVDCPFCGVTNEL